MAAGGELDLWAFIHGVTRDFSRSGKRTDNAFIESLNGKFRAECLNANWFMSLDEAIEKCEAWRRDYNEVRPHSAICNEVPAALPATPASQPYDEAGIFRRRVVQGWEQAQTHFGGPVHIWISDVNIGKIDILVSHSHRPVDFSQCSFEALSIRYAALDRLQRLPALKDLPPMSASRTYNGGLSLLRLDLELMVLEDRGYREVGRKIQHATFVGQSIVVCLEDSLMVVDNFHDLPPEYPDNEDSRRIDDPWFAGLHTCLPIDRRSCLVSASAPDAFLWVDLGARRVTRRLRLSPEIYGYNYDLEPETSLQDHYIGNDQQLAHLNCACPLPDGGVLYTTLIQGHLGRYRPTDGWSVLRSGNIGCHGGRAMDDLESYYFVDSVKGDLVLTDVFGEHPRRISRPSRWMHDAQQIPGTRLFLLAESDRNTLTVVDSDTGEVKLEHTFQDRGASLQFLHTRRCPNN